MFADTIFALSSGRPPAAIAVIRISGPGAHAAGEALAGPLPPARTAAVRELRGLDGELLDRALLLRFDAPASATGENSVELQCHGGRAVTDAVLAALAGLEGLRLAAPGEFTRRAFANGRIDLTEAEGLADLLEAETETQRRAALALAEGGLRRQIEAWQQQLISLSARAESAIDYVEEADVDIDPGLLPDCASLAAELRRWLERPRTEPLRDGVRVVIAGPPNAGKSSLLNAIVGSEKAIVTSVAGTTRDIIDVPVAINGFPLVLTDTAGIRDTDELVERIGVERARAQTESADILLWLGEPADAPGHRALVHVHPRCDLPERRVGPDDAIAVSSLSGRGIGELTQRVAFLAKSLLPAEGAVAINRRQAAHIQQAAEALDHLGPDSDVVIVAEQLRIARGAFDRLTGRAGVDDVLDALFARFCLGK
jgi:tRNA modification GTPase